MIQRVYLTPKGRQQNIENTKFKYEHHFVICLSSSLIKILNYLIILVFNFRTFISDFNTVKCLFMYSSWSSRTNKWSRSKFKYIDYYFAETFLGIWNAIPHAIIPISLR